MWSLPFTFINHKIPKGHVCLLSIQRQSFVPGTNTSSPSPLFPVLCLLLSLSYFLCSVPTGPTNLLCAEKVALGILSRY